MNHTITNPLAALLLLTIGVMGCTKEETLSGDTPDTERIPMTISVTDGGYAANDKSAAQTRAVENGYVTEFTAGDKIGLYMVKSDGSYVQENLALTLADNGDGNGTLAWTLPADTKLYYDAEVKYFAYYPYQSELTGELVPTASDAAEFFANIVSGWSPATDQSTHARYTAQDLMIGSGTVFKQAGGTCPLALTMTHAMALVVIETPTTKYTFNNDNPTIPDYYIHVLDTKFDGFIPYNPTVGTYRYLVKPAQSVAPKLMGSYKAGNTKEYKVEQNNIAAASYALYKVDGGLTEKTHTLKVGDYYMKDGSLLSESEIPNEAQQAACIGIVYWVGDAAAKDQTLKKDHPGCTHGLVAALSDDVQKHLWAFAIEDVQRWLDGNENTVGKFLPVKTGMGANDPLNNIQGYNNTKAIEAFNNNSKTDYPVIVVQKAVDYRSTVPAPGSSSDWYLPSAKELTLLCGRDVDNIQINGSGGIANRDLINGKLSSISGANQLTTSFYWSSSEISDVKAVFVFFTDGTVSPFPKNREYGVRFSLAF